MNKILIKALGQTIEHEGEVSLVVKELPVNCMALFVDMETWHKIKDDIEYAFPKGGELTW